MFDIMYLHFRNRGGKIMTTIAKKNNYHFDTYCSGRDEKLEEFIFLIRCYPHFYFVLRQLLINPEPLLED